MNDDALSLYQPALPALLAERAVEYLAHAQAPNTKRTYASAWSDFTAFCDMHALAPLPASVPTLAAYLTFLARAQRISTLRVKLSAISAEHRHAGLPDPTLDGRIRELLRGIRRAHGAPSQQKTEITRAELFAILRALDEDIEQGKISPLRGARNKALLVLTFAGAFRRGEVAALELRDLEFTQTEMIVTLRRSKTDQEGRGLKKHIPRLDSEDVCPVRLVRAWLRLAQLKRGPLFRAIDQFDHVRKDALCDRAVNLFVKQAVTRIGLDPAAFGAHSLKAGITTQGFLDGFEEWEVQSVTGHKSRAVLQKYNRRQEQAQARVIRGVLKNGKPHIDTARE